MGAKVRFFTSKPLNILIMRFMGNLRSQALFRQLRKFVAEDPPIINAPEIWDARTWGGMVFDDELAEQIAWNYKFRLQHGLATNNLPPIVLLIHRFSGSADIGSQFSGFRDQPIPVCFDPEAAWAHLVPDSPLPDDVRKFLARR